MVGPTTSLPPSSWYFQISNIQTAPPTVSNEKKSSFRVQVLRRCLALHPSARHTRHPARYCQPAPRISASRPSIHANDTSRDPRHRLACPSITLHTVSKYPRVSSSKDTQRAFMLPLMRGASRSCRSTKRSRRRRHSGTSHGHMQSGPHSLHVGPCIGGSHSRRAYFFLALSSISIALTPMRSVSLHASK